MLKKIFFLIILGLYLFSIPSAYSKKNPLHGEESSCYQCHEEIKSLKMGSKHASLPCEKCHHQLNEHLKDPEKLPGTNLELSLCGKCHSSQYETFLSVNLKPKPFGGASTNGQESNARIVICPGPETGKAGSSPIMASGAQGICSKIPVSGAINPGLRRKPSIRWMPSRIISGER